MVGCVLRLVLWCVNVRRYFLCYFKLISVEMNGLSVAGCLIGMVILADFLLLENELFGRMVGMDMMMEVAVEVVVMKAVAMLQAGFFVFSGLFVWGM